MNFIRHIFMLLLSLSMMSYAMEQRPPSTTAVNPYQSIVITKSIHPYKGDGVLILAGNSEHPKLGGAGFFVNGNNETVVDYIEATPERQYIGSRVLCAMLHFFPKTKEVFLGSYERSKGFYRTLDFTQTPGPDSRRIRGSDYFFWYQDAWDKQGKKFRFTWLNDNQIQVDLIPKNNSFVSSTHQQPRAIQQAPIKRKNAALIKGLYYTGTATLWAMAGITGYLGLRKAENSATRTKLLSGSAAFGIAASAATYKSFNMMKKN